MQLPINIDPDRFEEILLQDCIGMLNPIVQAPFQTLAPKVEGAVVNSIEDVQALLKQGFYVYYDLANNSLQLTIRRKTTVTREIIAKVDAYNEELKRLRDSTLAQKFHYGIKLLQEVINYKNDLCNDVPMYFNLVTPSFLLLSGLLDAIKQRNNHLYEIGGWWLFDWLASAGVRIKPTHEKNRPHMVFFLTMREHLVNELPQLIRLYQQIHDTEAYIESARQQLGGGANDAVVHFLEKGLLAESSYPTPLYDTFLNNRALLHEVVLLQLTIEQGIQNNAEVKVEDQRLKALVKQHHLKIDIPEHRFYSGSVINYESLNKLIEYCSLAQPINQLDQPKARYAMLNIVRNIGEYVTHKKLSNSLKEGYQTVPWVLFENLRDFMIHLDEHNGYDCLQQLMAKDTAFFELLKADLMTMKTVFEDVLKREFPKPVDDFLSVYFDSRQPKNNGTVLDKAEFKTFKKHALSQSDEAYWSAVRRGIFTPSLQKYRELFVVKDQLKAPIFTKLWRACLHRLSQEMQKHYRVDQLLALLTALTHLNDPRRTLFWLERLGEPAQVFPDVRSCTELLSLVHDQCHDQFQLCGDLIKRSKPIHVNIPTLIQCRGMFAFQPPEDNDNIGHTIDVAILCLDGMRNLFESVLGNTARPELIDVVNEQGELIRQELREVSYPLGRYQFDFDPSKHFMDRITKDFPPEIASQVNQQSSFFRQQINDKIGEFLDQHRYPHADQVLTDDVELYNALELMMLSSLSLLKKIVKITEAEKADHLNGHFSGLQRTRNFLAHGHHLLEISQNISKIKGLRRMILNDCQQLKSELEQIKADFAQNQMMLN